MDIPPKNEFVSLDTLERYVEKYPEDAEKWIEFIKDPSEESSGKLRRSRHRTNSDTINEDILKLNSDIYNLESEIPIEDYNDGCLFCKKSWVSTDNVPTITLICGHKFHTVCLFIEQFNNDMSRCIVEDCEINTWDYVRQIIREKDNLKKKSDNILLDAIKNRNDFKKDLRELKQTVYNATVSHGAVTNFIEEGRKEFIHKNVYSMNQMRHDLNLGVKHIKESEQMSNYKSYIRLYRKKAKYIFEKYHLSFRELYQSGLIKTSWRMRWILERHRSPFSYHRMGFRIYAGKKVWKDPL